MRALEIRSRAFRWSRQALKCTRCALPAQISGPSVFTMKSFGSWSMTLRYNEPALRLDFDGREGHLEIRRTRDRKPLYKYESASLMDEGHHFGTLDARGGGKGYMPFRNLVERSRRGLTNRWSGRVMDKVPSSYTGVRAAQLNR